MKRLQTLRALRENYTRKGVWAWLKGRKKCRACGSTGVRGRGSFSGAPTMILCLDCNGKPKRGYQRILSEPNEVIREQGAIAEGVMG